MARAKRGWFNVVGSVLHTAFGVARDGDLSRIRHPMSEMEANMALSLKHIAADSQSHSSFQAGVKGRFDSLEAWMRLMDNHEHQHYDRLVAGLNRNTELQNQLLMQVARLTDFVIILQTSAQLKQGILEATRGSLSPLLFTPAVVTEMFANITALLPRGQRLACRSPSEFYRLKKLCGNSARRYTLLYL
jgi:hypothetical protein